MWIKLSKLHWHVEIITAEMVSVRENSSQQNSQKTVFTRFFLELFGYKTFIKIYFILRDFQRDKFTGKWFFKNLEK
jgi:hypothetical protein